MGLTLSQKVVANPGTFAEGSELDRRPDLRVPSTEPRLIVSLRLTCESIAVSNRRVGFYETHLPVHNGVLIEQAPMGQVWIETARNFPMWTRGFFVMSLSCIT
jgi:hypothetical protein